MKVYSLQKAALIIALSGCLGAHAADGVPAPRLEDIPDGHGWKGRVDAVQLAHKDGASAVELNGQTMNVVWLDGVEFREGTLEFDVKGKSAPPQKSFVGVAFRVVDETTYDAVYFRPFNFQAEDSTRAAHMVQYVSEPQWPWHRLRNERSGQYEKPIAPAPNGDDWFHARVEVEARQVKVFVNGADKPSLVVDELSDRPAGSVGLWWYGYGAIANLVVTPTDLNEQVRAAETAFAKTLADRDLAAFGGFLADEAVFFDGPTPLRGKEVVVAGWSPFFEGEDAPFSWTSETVEVLASGTLAHSSGPVFTPDGKKVGIFNSVWRREDDGSWKVVFDKGCAVCE